MANKAGLKSWIVDALNEAGGVASLIKVAQYIWREHEQDLRQSEDLFFTWQYDMRWAAMELRKDGVLADADSQPRGVWALR